MPTYILDPTGTSSLNRVEDEVLPVTSEIVEQYGFIIPRYAPFYSEGMVITYTDKKGTVRTMIKGLDYVPVYKFVGATVDPDKPVYGAIGLLRKNVVTSVQVTYQSMGGDWVIDREGIRMYLANAVLNPNLSYIELVAKQKIYIPLQEDEWLLDTFEHIATAQEYISPITLEVKIKTLPENLPEPYPTLPETLFYNRVRSMMQDLATDKAQTFSAKIAAEAAAVIATNMAAAAEVSRANALVSANSANASSLIATDAASASATSAAAAHASELLAAEYAAEAGTGGGGGGDCTCPDVFDGGLF